LAAQYSYSGELAKKINEGDQTNDWEKVQESEREREREKVRQGEGE